MSDAVDRGITVTEMAPMGLPIDMSPETTAAFVGRALRGPLNTPTLLHSFGEFRRRFGTSWSRSSLGPAVRQFFEHGGSKLFVVRVANNVRGAMLCLPASGSALVLRALEPGSTECVRAAVDFDGIDSGNDELFNLTLQRVDPESGLVTDQEMFRRVSYREESDDFVADALLTSTLARIEHPFPTHRPEATSGVDVVSTNSYVEHAQEGSDGHELSDYDLIGSRKYETGLFALQQVEHIDLLYLPPPGKCRDLGPASILAAELYCRQRGAMLITDPSHEWSTAEEAITGVREQGYASPNMISYFPRMYERHADDAMGRAIGGALAGLLCKLDRHYGPWRGLDALDLGLSRDLVPHVDLDDDEAAALVREGMNIIVRGDAGRARVTGAVTMGRGSETHRKFASLAVRRTCLHIVGSIERATRWAVVDQGDPKLAKRLSSQVHAYLSGLADMGAFENDRFTVDCELSSGRSDQAPGRAVTILIAFQPLGCREPVSFTLHQDVTGCRVATTAFAKVLEDCA